MNGGGNPAPWGSGCAWVSDTAGGPSGTSPNDKSVNALPIRGRAPSSTLLETPRTVPCKLDPGCKPAALVVHEMQGRNAAGQESGGEAVSTALAHGCRGRRV